MSKISRRSFLETTALGSGLVGSAMLGATLPLEKVSKLLPSATTPPAPREPNFLRWSFGGQNQAAQMEVKSSEFRAWFEPQIERKRYHFRAEVLAACEKIDQRRQGQTVALCLSGGVDSEIIALALREKGVPFELYFLDNWGLNFETYQHWVKPFAKSLEREVHVVGLSRPFFLYEHGPAAFLELGCEQPTYLALTHLFENIPTSQFIVTGDGDLDRQGSLYTYIGKKHPVAPADAHNHLPFSSASVAYRIWAQKRNRTGEFYFFHSTPELIAAAFTDPLFHLTYPAGNTKDVIHAAFPEIIRRPKTTNWDSPLAAKANDEFRHRLRAMVSDHPELAFWRPALGTPVKIDNIFTLS